MLDNNCKQILSFLKPYAKQNQHVKVDAQTIHEETSISMNEVILSLDYLQSIGFLEVAKFLGGQCIVLKVNYEGINFEEISRPIPQPSQTFNISSVNNSAFGNTGNITINNGISYEEARNIVNDQQISNSEKDDFNKIIDYIETLTENESPLKKGFLSKFGDKIAKHSWAPNLIGNLLIKYFTKS